MSNNNSFLTSFTRHTALRFQSEATCCWLSETQNHSLVTSLTRLTYRLMQKWLGSFYASKHTLHTDMNEHRGEWPKATEGLVCGGKKDVSSTRVGRLHKMNLPRGKLCQRVIIFRKPRQHGNNEYFWVKHRVFQVLLFLFCFDQNAEYSWRTI